MIRTYNSVLSASQTSQSAPSIEGKLLASRWSPTVLRRLLIPSGPHPLWLRSFSGRNWNGTLSLKRSGPWRTTAHPCEANNPMNLCCKRTAERRNLEVRLLAAKPVRWKVSWERNGLQELKSGRLSKNLLRLTLDAPAKTRTIGSRTICKQCFEAQLQFEVLPFECCFFWTLNGTVDPEPLLNVVTLKTEILQGIRIKRRSQPGT